MIPYWLDHCPTCGHLATISCRCLLNDRRCPNSHWWRRGPHDEPIKLNGPHGSEGPAAFITGEEDK